MSNRFQSIIQQKSSDELLEMVYQFTEWDPEMLDGVEAELQKRNILPADITIRKQQLINSDDQELLNGREASLTSQIAGWLGVLGLIGLIIGYDYTFSKVKSKYSKKVYYKFDKESVA